MHLCNTLSGRSSLPTGLWLLYRANRTVVLRTAGPTSKILSKGNPGLKARRPRQKAVFFSTKALRVTLTAAAASTQQRDWLPSRLAGHRLAGLLSDLINQ